MPDRELSFAKRVKEEITTHDFSDDCLRSLLSSYARCNGTLHIEDGREELDLSSESSSIAKFLYECVKKLYGVDVRFSYTKGMGFYERLKYHVLISESESLLGDLEVDYFSGRIPKNVVASPEQESAYLSGAFLAAGSVNDPRTPNYHLEIAVGEESYARWLSHLINKTKERSFTSKIIARRKQWVVYIKRNEQIPYFLVMVGAQEAALHFQDVIIERDFSCIGNRLHNLDTANMGKTLSSSKRQIEEIEYYVAKHGWSGIESPKLKELMKLRLDHPDASLEELAVLLSTELASTVSKSNVNHLFRFLHQEYLKDHGEN